MRREPVEVLGAVAHPGGLLVRHPEVSIGVVRAAARSSGLTLDLIARTPRDPNGAPRPDLTGPGEWAWHRVGWLDSGGQVHWQHMISGEFGGMGGGDTVEHRGLCVLPPLFGEVSLVFEWSEIGFPETVVPLVLPTREEVERTERSIWSAPRAGVPVEEEFERDHSDRRLDRPALEQGVAVAAPMVLHRSDDAAVVLNRLTDHGSQLSLEVLSVARGAVTRVIAPALHGLREIGPSMGGADIDVVRGRTAHRVWSFAGSGSSGVDAFTARTEHVLERPDSGVLDLLVSWPLVGLDEVRVELPLTPEGVRART